MSVKSPPLFDPITDLRFWPATSDKLYSETYKVNLHRLGEYEDNWKTGFLTVHDYTGPRTEKTTGYKRNNNHFTTPSWMVIDLDRTKSKEEDKKRGATKAELGALSDLTDTVHEYLTSIGFPLINRVCSGNGYHLYYKPDEDWTFVDIKRLLHYLDKKFGGNGYDIDSSVNDSSRLIRLPGTVNEKKPPHRKTGRRVTVEFAAPEITTVPLSCLPEAPTKEKKEIVRVQNVRPVKIDMASASNTSEIIEKTLFAWWTFTRRIDYSSHFEGGTDRYKMWLYAARELINAGANYQAIHDFFQFTQDKYDRTITDSKITWMLREEINNAGQSAFELLKPGLWDTLIIWRHRQSVKNFNMTEIKGIDLIPMEVISYGSDPVTYTMKFHDGKKFHTDSKSLQTSKAFHRWIIEERGVYVPISRFSQFHPRIAQVMLNMAISFGEEKNHMEQKMEEFILDLRKTPISETRSILLLSGLVAHYDEADDVIYMTSRGLREHYKEDYTTNLRSYLSEQGILKGPSKRIRVDNERVRVWPLDPKLWIDAHREHAPTSAEAIAQSVIISLQKRPYDEEEYVLTSDDPGAAVSYCPNPEGDEIWVASHTIDNLIRNRAPLEVIAEQFEKMGCLAGPAQVKVICDGDFRVRVFRFRKNLWERKYQTEKPFIDIQSGGLDYSAADDPQFGDKYA